MCEYAEDVVPAEGALVVDALEEGADELLLGLAVGLLPLLPVHHVSQDVEHDVSDGVAEVVRLVTEERDEAREVGVEDLGNAFGQLR